MGEFQLEEKKGVDLVPQDEQTIEIEPLFPDLPTKRDVYLVNALKILIHRVLTQTKFEVTGLSVKLEDDDFEELIKELKILLKATGEDNALKLFIKKIKQIEYEDMISIVEFRARECRSERVRQELELVKKLITDRYEARQKEEEWAPSDGNANQG
jgi:hypothetical protein